MPVFRLCRRPAFVLIVVLGLGTGTLGCNVFEVGEPTATSVEDLLADARVAMTKNDPQRAVRLLEDAFKKDSTNVEVRIELVNALYAAHGVDVFSLRTALEPGEVKATAAKTDPPVCSAGGDSTRSSEGATVFIDRESNRLQELEGHRKRMQRASRLVIQGVLEERPEAFAAEAHDTRAKGYLLAALTRASLRLLAVQTAVRETKGTLYVDDSGSASSRAFIACGPSTEAVVRIERTLCRLEEGFSQAVSWLRSRNELVGSEQTSLLISPLETNASAVQARRACDAS